MQSLCSQATAAAQNTATTLCHPHKLTCAHTYISIRIKNKTTEVYRHKHNRYRNCVRSYTNVNFVISYSHILHKILLKRSSALQII